MAFLPIMNKARRGVRGCAGYSVNPPDGGQEKQGESEMMASSLRIAGLTLATLACVAPARAGWFSSMVQGSKNFYRSVVRDTKHRNCWPTPFVQPDRHSARAPFALMVSNGWRRQNLLGDHHFVDQTGELTESGRIKVRWILTEAPRHHRTIYVHRATEPGMTIARIDNVQQLAAQLVPQGTLPMVLETSIPVQGWPAARADMIGRKFDASIPDPRLPEAAGGEEE